MKKELISKLKNNMTIFFYKNIFIYRKNTRNIGDQNCSPQLFFSEFKGMPSIDIMQLDNLDISNKTIIVGGGGLLQEYFNEKLYILNKLSKKNKIIYWGVGQDNSGQVLWNKFSLLDNAVLIGLRDKNSIYEKVACPSCMSTLFDKYRNNMQSGIIYYLHHDYSAPYLEKFSSCKIITNKEKSFEDTIKHLSSAEVVVTNSYHGMYWSTLLNKKVVVIPFVNQKGEMIISEKFRQYIFDVVICDNINNLDKCIEKAKNHKNALEIARKTNIIFKEKVLNYL